MGDPPPPLPLSNPLGPLFSPVPGSWKRQSVVPASEPCPGGSFFGLLSRNTQDMLPETWELRCHRKVGRILRRWGASEYREETEAPVQPMSEMAWGVQIRQALGPPGRLGLGRDAPPFRGHGMVLLLALPHFTTCFFPAADHPSLVFSGSLTLPGTEGRGWDQGGVELICPQPSLGPRVSMGAQDRKFRVNG